MGISRDSLCKPFEFEVELEPGHNSHQHDLMYARSHEDLANRPELSVRVGLSLREPLYTKDYWNRS